jgi:hypothetical protein
LEKIVVGKLPKNIVIAPIFPLADFFVLKAKVKYYRRTAAKRLTHAVGDLS